MAYHFCHFRYTARSVNFNYGNEFWVKIALGLLIIFYALYAVSGKNAISLKTDSKLWLFICGFVSGVLGGAYGVNGPPLVVYGNMRNWSAKHFRATLQAYFLPASFIGFRLLMRLFIAT